MNIYYSQFPTGFGPMMAVADEKGLLHLSFQKGEDPIVPQKNWIEVLLKGKSGKSHSNLKTKNKNTNITKSILETLRKTQSEIESYLSGKNSSPKIKFGELKGTDFQQRVWKRLAAIPYGKTRTYGQIAKEIGLPKAARAVGAACGANPVLIFIPCHRVVGANGSLTGFSSGLEFKVQLLEKEGSLPP